MNTRKEWAVFHEGKRYGGFGSGPEGLEQARWFAAGYKRWPNKPYEGAEIREVEIGPDSKVVGEGAAAC